MRGILRLFFRDIAVEGREHVPAEGGGLLVAWHPNGIIDPGLMLAAFPREVVFGARPSSATCRVGGVERSTWCTLHHIVRLALHGLAES